MIKMIFESVVAGVLGSLLGWLLVRLWPWRCPRCEGHRIYDAEMRGELAASFEKFRRQGYMDGYSAGMSIRKKDPKQVEPS